MTSTLREIKKRVRRRLLGSEPTFRLYLAARSGFSSPKQPPVRPLNAALQSRQQAREAYELVRSLGLPPHEDMPKNWDALGAVSQIVRELPTSATVLDAGAEDYSPILPWLYRYGFRNLHGNNLVFDRAFSFGAIRYVPGDITRSEYPSEHFDAVTCMSVIEHGVDVEAFLRESARILKPSGLLAVSCDYFEQPTDTRGLSAYGTPVKVFDRSEIEGLLATAARLGLEPVGEVDLSCDERAVHWKRLDLSFTFLLLTLRKRRA